MGLITPAGKTVAETEHSVMHGHGGFRRISIFPTPRDDTFPAGEIRGLPDGNGLPRTHVLARIAAEEAMAGSEKPPGAIIMGTTTGGMSETENNLRKQNLSPESYRYHAAGSVADYLASILGCTGPVITISTACSSSAAAIKVAMEMLRQEKIDSVLTVGADSLCRLTYYGFKSLQLIDPTGAKPFDLNRKGMTVAEGAGAIFLQGTNRVPKNAIAEILGSGLSCDAYHPASPHPEGRGALEAMHAALMDAGISPMDVDYLNLHGTGTIDNDISESAAVIRLFKNAVPAHSSVKGVTGHSLAAAGVIESIISVMAVKSSMVPPNTGCTVPDPALGMNPVGEPVIKNIRTVLSNSFGFGGNNAAVVIGAVRKSVKDKNPTSDLFLAVTGRSLVSGAGFITDTLKAVLEGKDCKGILPEKELTRNLPAKKVRRMKRLSRIALSLGVEAWGNSGLEEKPGSLFFGTGWGSLSETFNFMNQLTVSNDKFASPTDFIGSVHNAPAGQIGIEFQATGPNITTTGGDYSFEQALMTASLLSRKTDKPILVIGADESHETLSPLFDRSTCEKAVRSDGGGAILLKRGTDHSGINISSIFLQKSSNDGSTIRTLISDLGGPGNINNRYSALFAGIPEYEYDKCNNQLHEFIKGSKFAGPVIDYRKITGQFASASAVAAVLAIAFTESGKIPESLCGKGRSDLDGKGILMVGLGPSVTGIEILNNCKP